LEGRKKKKKKRLFVGFAAAMFWTRTKQELLKRSWLCTWIALRLGWEGADSAAITIRVAVDMVVSN
jgi:hypothetical protein